MGILFKLNLSLEFKQPDRRSFFLTFTLTMYECIISIDAAENVFGIDCLEYIMSDVDIRLQFMYFHTDLQKRQALSANYDLALERLRKDNALTLSQKTDSLSKFLFYNCGLRDMPIKSVGVSESELILIMFVPVSSSDLTKDNEVMGSALRMFRYSILAASIYDSLFTKYRVTAIDENGTPNGLICTTDFELLNKYNMEQAGLVDLLNGSSLHLQDQRITIKVDFEKLTELEQSSLDDSFPRLER